MTKGKTKEPTVHEMTEFMEELEKLFAQKNRAKNLSVYALLKHDPGEDYTEAEIRQAIEYLNSNDKDKHTAFIQDAVQWLQCLPRAEQITA